MELERFVRAQDPVWPDVVAELRAGRKRTHWMWFVFPQIVGLGRSPTAQHYALPDLDAARGYLHHSVLGPRLLEATGLLLPHRRQEPENIFGPTDALKLRSSMTLFERAAPTEPAFGRVLEAFYRGERCAATLARI